MKAGEVEWWCSECFSKNVEKATCQETKKLGGHVFVAELPATKCLKCGKTARAPRAWYLMNRCIAQEFLRAGDFNGEAIQTMREVMDLKAVQLAALLGVRKETISRWETGRWPIARAAAIALGSLFGDFLEGRQTTQQLIQALQSSQPLPKSVNLGKIQPSNP